VVIDAEFGMEDHGSIPATVIGRRLLSLDARTDPRTRLGGQMGRILVVKEKKIQNRANDNENQQLRNNNFNKNCCVRLKISSFSVSGSFRFHLTRSEEEEIVSNGEIS
jgi:hypothetical protein